MKRYCLDANTFIQPATREYPMDVHPGFWDWLDHHVDEGTIYTSTLVYDELKDEGDDLSIWVKDRHPSPLFESPTAAAQAIYSQIADFVTTTTIYPFKVEEAARFLSGADAWLIAQAKVDGATVVTMETLVDATSTKVKIPNICNEFSIPHMNIYKLQRQLGAKFIRG